MSDNSFIPLHQSTPGDESWQGRQQGGYRQHNNQKRNSQKKQRYFDSRSSTTYIGDRSSRYRNNSNRNSSYGSDSNNSYGQDMNNIDAYLHPSMLQDPWEQLRRKQNHNN